MLVSATLPEAFAIPAFVTVLEIDEIGFRRAGRRKCNLDDYREGGLVTSDGAVEGVALDGFAPCVSDEP